ncbi:Uncharacterised protein [Vibrio cholerae]|nr:Uncharacterised protein [Vibrio cholerae]CSC98288.1 Uncharacterised protein [Vibrio cholerae]
MLLLLTKQNHFLTGEHALNLGHINHSGVHRCHSHDFGALSIDQHFGFIAHFARVTIRITHRQVRQHTVTAGSKSTVITHS